MTTILPLTDRDHLMSTLALCSCALSSSYLIISVFPYSGYMTISLLNSPHQDSINEENVGYYSGLLTSSFMMGRALTANTWGKTTVVAANVYGRKTIIFASLFSSIVFSIQFGLSTSFPLALLCRFLLGLGNGMMSTVKTVVSELAVDDDKREMRAMGHVMAMWGWGFLICPIISGMVAEPTKQYADWWGGEQSGNAAVAADRWIFQFLDTFPFILPNLIGALISLVSVLLVALFVPETLPRHQIRVARHIPGDFFRSFHRSFHRSILSVIPEVSESRENSIFESRENSVLIDMDDDNNGKENNANYNSINPKQADDNSNIDDDNRDDDNDDFELPSNIVLFVKDDVQGAIRASIQSYNEEITMLYTITGKGRGSITNAALRRVSSSPEQQQRRISDEISSQSGGTTRGQWRRSSLVSALTTEAAPDDDVIIEEAATIKSLWARVNTRNHMIVYWIASFVLVAVDEGFPLFCISKQAGLGLSEYSIGSVLSASGLLFVLLQYLIYAAFMDNFGIYGSLRITSLAFPMIALVPISLWLNHPRHPEGYDNDDNDGNLAWASFSFLSILLAVYRVFAVAYFTTLVVALNRSVIPAHRGKMNGLTALGGSITKGVGPTFAGLLVAFSLSSGVFSPHVGAVFMWLIIGGLGCVNCVATFMLLHDDCE